MLTTKVCRFATSCQQHADMHLRPTSFQNTQTIHIHALIYRIRDIKCVGDAGKDLIRWINYCINELMHVHLSFD